jgi:hypothetical protein
VAYFKVLSRHLSGKTDGDCVKPPAAESNSGPPELGAVGRPCL